MTIDTVNEVLDRNRSVESRERLLSLIRQHGWCAPKATKYGELFGLLRDIRSPDTLDDILCQAEAMSRFKTPGERHYQLRELLVRATDTLYFDLVYDFLSELSEDHWDLGNQDDWFTTDANPDRRRFARVDDTLLDAYNKTRFNYDWGDDTHTLRIGKVSEDLLERLNGTHSAVYITAWNPYSDEVDQNANRAMNFKLHQELGWFTSHPVLPGVGVSEDGQWREDCFLAVGIDRLQATDLCVRFKQNAVVFIPPTGIPELIINPLLAD